MEGIGSLCHDDAEENQAQKTNNQGNETPQRGLAGNVAKSQSKSGLQGEIECVTQGNLLSFCKDQSASEDKKKETG